MSSLFKKIFRKPSVMFSLYDKMRDGQKASAADAAAQLAEATAKTDAAKAAADAQYAETTAAKLANEAAMRNMQMNAAKVTDANNAVSPMARLSNVMAGGSAAAVSTNAVRVKKKSTGALSDVLGIRL